MAVWWATAPKPAEPAAASDHPYATQVRFEPRFDVSKGRQRNVGGVIENCGDRYIRTLKLALNVVGADAKIRNTARYRPLPSGDVNIAPGERLAVVFQVFPARAGRGEFLVEEIEVGLPADGPRELRPIEVVPTARAGVDSLDGVLEHQLRHERADASRGQPRLPGASGAGERDEIPRASGSRSDLVSGGRSRHGRRLSYWSGAG